MHENNPRNGMDSTPNQPPDEFDLSDFDISSPGPQGSAVPSPQQRVPAAAPARLQSAALDLDSALKVVKLTGQAASLCVSRDGKLIGVGQWDGRIALLDARNGQLIGSQAVAQSGFTLLELGPQNQTITAHGREIRAGGAEDRSVRCPADVLALKLSPDGSSLAAIVKGGKALLYDYPSLEARHTLQIPRGWLASLFRGGKDAISAAVFSPDSATLALSMDDGKRAGIYLFDAASGKLKRGPVAACDMAAEEDRPNGFNPTISALSFSSDGAKLCAVYRTYSGGSSRWVDKAFLLPADGAGAVTAVGTSYYQASTPLAGEGMSASSHPTRPLLAVGHSGTVGFGATSYIGYSWWQTGLIPKVRLMDTETGRTVKCLIGHAGPVDFVSFTQDGSRLVTAGREGNLVLWDAQRLLSSAERTAAFDDGAYLQFSPTGRSVVGSYERGVIVEDFELER